MMKALACDLLGCPRNVSTSARSQGCSSHGRGRRRRRHSDHGSAAAALSGLDYRSISASITVLSGFHSRTPVRSMTRKMPETKPGELLNTGANLAGAALQLVGRLRDHIERLDDGRAYAADDLAVVLRCLLCSGKGNRVLMRLTQTDGLTVVPRVRLSRPAPDDDDVFFAVGSVPVDEPGASSDGATEATLTKWMNRRVLTVTSAGSRTTYTWNRFLSTYAEKWGGAHLDEVVPPHLRMIDDHAVGGLPLSNYLLRMAAVAAWDAAQEILGEVLKDVVAKAEKASKNANIAHGEARRHSAIFAPEGGISAAPRSIESRGLLQAFAHRTEQIELLWYVDSTSPDNALHLRFGTLPYDIRYEGSAVPSTEAPVTLQAQRQPDRSKTIEVGPGPIKQKTVNGVVLTLDQVRTRADDARFLSSSSS
jgi:hypothetical protein